MKKRNLLTQECDTELDAYYSVLRVEQEKTSITLNYR